MSAPNATSLFPVGVALQEYAMSGVEFTHLSLRSAFLRQVAWEMDLQDRFELAPQWAIGDQQIESIARAAEYEIRSDLSAGHLFMESLATALAAHLLTPVFVASLSRCGNIEAGCPRISCAVPGISSRRIWAKISASPSSRQMFG